VNVPLAYCLSRFTNLPIVPLYAICVGVDVFKCLVGFAMIRKGLWIRNLTE
jgi:Na+-driven multidrug efflux pump